MQVVGQQKIRFRRIEKSAEPTLLNICQQERNPAKIRRRRINLSLLVLQSFFERFSAAAPAAIGLGAAFAIGSFVSSLFDD